MLVIDVPEKWIKNNPDGKSVVSISGDELLISLYNLPTVSKIFIVEIRFSELSILNFEIK